MSQHKKGLFLFMPGPKYHLRVVYQDRLKALSKNFHGVLITTADEHEELEVGEFKIIAFKHAEKSGSLSLFLAAKQAINQYEKDVGKIDLIISYDPLKVGILSWVISKIIRAKLLVEVNGDFAAPGNYIDIESKLKRALKRWAVLLVERRVLNRADAIKLLYDSQLEDVKYKGSCPIIKAFPNYVDLSIFSPMPQEKQVLLVGFPYRLKGVDLLIEAFKRVSDRFPDWHLKIMGWVDKQELERDVAGHPRIIYQPPVFYDEMPKHMAKASILVLPSRTEGMGRVLLEAAACNVARIGSRVGGIPSIVEDGVDGLLFPSENVEELAKKLDQLMKDSGLRESLSKAAYERLQREFIGERYYQRCDALYQEVLGSE